MIGILDYGSGNLFSISNALKKLNFKYKFIKEKKDFKLSTAIILPGVGSYKACMKKLEKKKFVESIYDYVESDGKLIGICLGMQMLLENSEEDGFYSGLKLLKGNVKYLNNQKMYNNQNYSIPNMGWSKIFINKPLNSKVFIEFNKNEFYFAHSLACQISEKKYQIAKSKFGNFEFCSIFKKDKIYGLQFHPEKSGANGLKMLKYILNE